MFTIVPDELLKKRYYSGKDKQNGTFEYVYNNKGELVQNFDEENNLKTKFEYDKFGRIVDLRRSDDIWSTIKYNALENLVEKITSKIFGINQTVENTFGASNNFENSKITTGNNSIWSKYFYNALGQVESKETLNADETTGLKHNISYVDGSDENRTTNLVESVNIQKKVSGSWIPLGKTFSYKYDDVGNISVLEENGTEKVWYYYDENDQLIRENNSYLGTNGKTITYKYDLGGNIQEKKIYALTPNNDYGDLADLTAETITYGYYDDNWKDQLSSYNGQEIIYDGMGNPISYKDGWKFEWERGRKLDKALNSCYNIVCKYDDEGIRTKKIVSKKIENEQTETKTLEFITSGIQILGQKTTTVITDINGNQIGDSTVDKVLWQIDGTGSVVGFEHNDTPYLYVKNTQDDIVAITNMDGDIVAEYEYGSWGKLLNTPTGIGEINPLRYRGYYYDGETGLYYLNARYYDPETGRFLNADDCDFLLEDDNDILDYNLYAYCGNNPVNMSDPDGEWGIFALAGGGIFSGFASFGGANFWNPIGWTIFGAAAVGVTIYGSYRLGRHIGRVYRANIQKKSVQKSKAVPVSTPANPKRPNNRNNNNNNRKQPPKKMTNKEADDVAKRLGYQKTNLKSQNRPVYRKGNRYITPDNTGHGGGIWKMGNNPRTLHIRGERMGTYNSRLQWIGK